MHDFSTNATAEVLDATPIQVKNWIQQARRTMNDRYGHTCALVTKNGVCHQCVELDGFFNREQRDPLTGTKRDLTARLEILRATRRSALGPWHCRMLKLVEDIIEGGGTTG